MRYVRLFDDNAFDDAWKQPRRVWASDTTIFGAKPGSRTWKSDFVTRLKSHLDPREFEHVFTRGAQAALELALAHKPSKRKLDDSSSAPSPTRARRPVPVDLAEYDDHDAAFDAVREYLVAALSDSSTPVQELIDALYEPELQQAGHMETVLADPGSLPLAALSAALRRAPHTLDAALVATCLASIQRIEDGTFVDTIRSESRVLE